MGTLRDDLIPQVRAILGDLRLSLLSDRLLVRVAGRSAGRSGQARCPGQNCLNAALRCRPRTGPATRLPLAEAFRG